MSLWTPVVEMCSLSNWCLQRSIFKLIAFWDTTIMLHLVASSPCFSVNVFSMSAEKAEVQASSGRFSIFSFRSWEERRELVKAAKAWSSAALRPNPPRSTGSWACVHWVLLMGTPRILIMASLVMLLSSLHSLSRSVGSVVRSMYMIFGNARHKCKRTYSVWASFIKITIH